MFNMYNEKFASYYDVLHSKKDYEEECKLILKNSINKKKLLDVGCGTLNHSIVLSNKFEKITAIDLSESMINCGLKKIKNLDIKNIETYSGPLSNISLSNQYDTIVSLFYVVNHIHSIQELTNFFVNTIELLNKEGVFIFDCWNGTACRIEKPKLQNSKSIEHDFHTIISKTITDTNLMDSTSTMKSNVKIYFEAELVDEFDYELEQKLWTPDIFVDILKSVGYRKISIIPYYNQDDIAKETDYKLTFICKKN